MHQKYRQQQRDLPQVNYTGLFFFSPMMTIFQVRLITNRRMLDALKEPKNKKHLFSKACLPQMLLLNVLTFFQQENATILADAEFGPQFPCQKVFLQV